VGSLQAQLDKQLVINNNYEPRIQTLNKRISELEVEVAKLRQALLKEQEVKEENEALKEAFRQVSDVARDPKRMRDFEKTVSTILNPLMDEVDVKLEAFLKSTTVVGRAATTPANRLKTQVNVLVKGLDRLLKSHDEFNI
jgi:chromosome segregation ATPase